MRKILILSAFVGLFIPEIVNGQCRINYNNYNLVLEENFDNRTSVDQLSDIWQFKHDDPGWGWGDRVDSATGQILEYGEYYDKRQLSLLSGGTSNGNQSGKILRFTNTKINGTEPVWSEWRNQWRYPKYRSGMLQLRNDLVNDSRFDRQNGGYFDQKTGFLYGMFEARVKFPSTHEINSAFWLTRAGSYTEIDFYEYGNNPSKREISNNVIWWHVPDNSNDACQGVYLKEGSADLAADWHVITGVWTPEKVTFFIDGREYRTVYNYVIPTSSIVPLSIIIGAGMSYYNSIQTSYFDVDYIKVYKAKHNDFSLSYKNSQESIPFDIEQSISNTSSRQNVHSAGNAIAVNQNDPNQVFYRGSNNWLYRANKLNSNQWSNLRLEYNDGSPVLAKGTVRYLPQHNLLLYVGSNDQINLFGNANTNPPYHWYLTSNWSCYWCVPDDKISSAPNSLHVASNEVVYYRGLDNKLHSYQDVGTWQHSIFPSANSSELVQGDIVTDVASNGATNIFYKGYDSKIQGFYKNGSGVYQHFWLDNNVIVSSKPGSMVWAKSLNGILYVNQFNQLFLYYYGSNGWVNQFISYSYASNGNDLLNGNIAWDNNNSTLHYIGNDGRMQTFTKDYATQQWIHYWIDDYWNNDSYVSYGVSNPNQYSSATFGVDGTIYYTRKNGHLAFFKYQPCENSTQPCFTGNNRYSIINSKLKLTTNEIVNVFPNPFSEDLKIEIEGAGEIDLEFSISDVQGKELNQKGIIKNGSSINLRELAVGMYFLSIKANGKTFTKKIFKN